MNKQIITVPFGIRYLSDWEGFCLPDHPCIIDKKLTGCGFTEFVIRGDFNSVLISPRRPLLENKVDQHNPIKKVIIEDELVDIEIPEERVLYYAKAQDQQDLGVDKDLEAKNPKESKEVQEQDSTEILKFKDDLRKAIGIFQLYGKPIKICVTYDSFRKVKEVLQELNLIDKFYYVVDEFQSIFTDSRFKPNTELEFVSQLQDLKEVSFISATPMIEDYLDLIDEFKDLPYYELDWESEDRSRIIKPEVIAKPCRRINEVAKKIITDFKNGKFERKPLLDRQGNPIKIVESKELIFYVNSVKNIADIIRQNKLMPEDVCVICAKTDENQKKIREAFKAVFKEESRSIKELPKEERVISKVPSPDKVTGMINNKPITLCTKTVYLGADFYSECARSIVLSDAGIECLAVDITLDLPQILGRQRFEINPWKNSIEIWFKLGTDSITQEEFETRRLRKIEKTNNLLSAYETAKREAKHDLAEEFEGIAKKDNYKNHYVAVNHHAGSDLLPQFNNLVMIAEKRAFDIQSLDYKDRFSVFSTIDEVFGGNTVDLSLDLQIYLEHINQFTQFHEKMKVICDKLNACPDIFNHLLSVTPEPYRGYIQVLGIPFISSSGYRKRELDKAYSNIPEGTICTEDDLKKVIISEFLVGERYTKSFIKPKLQEIYDRVGMAKKAKASDLEDWFELKITKITNKETGKRDMGFELLSLKQ